MKKTLGFELPSHLKPNGKPRGEIESSRCIHCGYPLLKYRISSSTIEAKTVYGRDFTQFSETYTDGCEICKLRAQLSEALQRIDVAEAELLKLKEGLSPNSSETAKNEGDSWKPIP